MSLLWLSASDVEHCGGLDPALARADVEEAVRAIAKRAVRVSPEKGVALSPSKGTSHLYELACCMEGGWAVQKLALHIGNDGSSGPSPEGTLITLIDQTRASPVAIMDGVGITYTRTAAMAALAADWLLGEPVERLAILGTGGLGRSVARVFAALHPELKLVNWWGRNLERLASAVKEVRTGVEVKKCGSASEALALAPVCVVATGATRPFLKKADLRGGRSLLCHVGQNDLCDDIAPSFPVVVVDAGEDALQGSDQSVFRWWREGRLAGSAAVVQMAGLIEAGARNRLRADDAPKLFASFGLVQCDLLIAARVFETAQQCGVGTRLQ